MERSNDNDKIPDKNPEQNPVGEITQRTLHLLELGFNRIIGTGKFQCLNKSLNGPDADANTIGLTGITNKFYSYKSVDEFLADIETLVQSYTAHSPNDKSVKKADKSLLDLCHHQVESVRICSDCFEYWVNDMPNYFTRVCPKPHLIIYVKMDGYPYWPAKVMSIDSGIVNVEFFGDHTQSNIPLKQCFLYSDEFDTKNIKDRAFNKAHEEVKMHIENITQKFGSFKPAQYKVAFDSETAEKHLQKMIPGAFDGHFSASERHTSNDDTDSLPTDSVAAKSMAVIEPNVEPNVEPNAEPIAEPIAGPSAEHQPNVSNAKRHTDDSNGQPKKRVRIDSIKDCSVILNKYDVDKSQNAKNDYEQPKPPEQNEEPEQNEATEQIEVPKVLSKEQIDEIFYEIDTLEDDKKQFEIQLKMLNELKARIKHQMKLCENGIWSLKKHLIITGNSRYGATCTNCGTASADAQRDNDDNQ